ncbi:MAG: SIMPL domain-containing protein [Alphaproteobacteria bacterium]|nr:SIMPL domain-containing protein [Alphaproteobacteria bacterium]
MTDKCKILCSFILSLGVALGGFFPGYYYYRSKADANYVTVKGLAEMNVKADLGVWDIKYIVTGNDLAKSQSKMTEQQNLIILFLKKLGFEDNEIMVQRTETNDLMANPYRSDSQNSFRYILTQTIQVKSTNVDLVEKAVNSTGSLISQGIVFDNNSYMPVSYIFTKINEIKPQMLEAATKNAMAAANEFAKSSNTKVGKIRKANQGVFSILPREQTANASEMNRIEKKVRVVSTIEYYLD